MSALLLKHVSADQFGATRSFEVDEQTIHQASEIIAAVRAGGTGALRTLAGKFGELKPDEALIFEKAELQAAAERIGAEKRAVLEHIRDRVQAFALAQRRSISDFKMPISGGEVAQHVTPVERAGCYAPGGRFPLPSSVLMTAVTAKVAGVKDVIVASPKPTEITCAAAYIAGASCLLRVGGAHAIAALAYGCDELDPVEVIVGPGNRWVTAAKKLVFGNVQIDMLAGPSELLIIADQSTDPALIAADLLAQAEHDDDAIPMLIALEESLVATVNAELEQQLQTLPTAETARRALKNGFITVAKTTQEAVELANNIAPEHLQVMTKDAPAVANLLKHFGAVFIGSNSAEVLGDYGAGPNHVLPTGGTARWSGGLSVFNFLRVNSSLQINDSAAAQGIVHDAIAIARMEGLEAHARAAERRKK